MKHETPTFRSSVYRSLGIVGSLLVLSAVGSAATYYVAPNGNDTNKGTLAAPFASLDKATYTAGPGDTIYVRGGTYRFAKRQNLKGNGNSTAWENLTAYPGEKPIIDESAFTETGDPIVSGGSYLKISGLEFRNSPTHGISMYGVNNFNIQNCTFRDAKSAGVYFGYKAIGTSYGLTVSGCEVVGCSKINAPVGKPSWIPAIFVDNSTDITVQNNSVHGNYGEGIGLRMSRDGNVRGNTVYDNYSVCIYLDNAATMTVDNNFVYSTLDARFLRNGLPANGIQMARENVPAPVPLDQITITNNVVTKCGVDLCYGSYQLAGGVSNLLVANNTFCGASSQLVSMDTDPNHRNNIFRNNIFYQFTTGSLTRGTAQKGLTFAANNWYGGKIAERQPGVGDFLGDPQMLAPGQNYVAAYVLSLTSPARALGIGCLQDSASVSLIKK